MVAIATERTRGNFLYTCGQARRTQQGIYFILSILIQLNTLKILINFLQKEKLKGCEKQKLYHWVDSKSAIRAPSIE